MTDIIPQVQYLKDYQKPKFDILAVFLEFDLHPTKTRVTNRMSVMNLEAVNNIVLTGESLKLISVLLDGRDITGDCKLSQESLSVPVVSGSFELTISTEISPETNTALEGLYRTSGNYCTQCEAEGFRKITYFLDRPDVLTLFTTKIISDKAENRILLSNGNLLESGDLDNNQHYVVWEDPFKKPCYLFALVAGNLESIKDEYVTVEGKSVALEIYVEASNIDKCSHAIDSLKKAMKWDEVSFGLSYDLDRYMIVAVDDFNMGAMENKGLNIFNSKFILAKSNTATDLDYERIEAVIGHEYFHNWTGNRVTCRDWFQLTLKEGLTVFRDQEFTADMLSPAVKRIEDVRHLRKHQFPEDAGPMAHPIQPQSYIEMNNFYTMTIYEKGAEIVRLYHTLLGESGFRKGMDLYFKRFDGQAVTIEEFRASMADANGIDLQQMRHWYIQSGTPKLKVETFYNTKAETYQITLTQGLSEHVENERFKPLLIPIKIALLTELGEMERLRPDLKTSKNILGEGTEVILCCTQVQQTFTFEAIKNKPIPSLLRGFSAPVKLEYEYSDKQLSLLANSDTDSFARWEAFQHLAMNEIKVNIKRFENNQDLVLSEIIQTTFLEQLTANEADAGLTSLTITLPDLTHIGEQYSLINPKAIYHVHQWLRLSFAKQYQAELLKTYQYLHSAEQVYRYNKVDIAQRKLKNVCLSYLMLLPEQFAIGKAQYLEANNMTDVLAALEAISHTEHAERESYLQHFYKKWHEDNLVLDKWFALQSASEHRHVLKHVTALVKHPDFKYSNPNRVRSVLGIFGQVNLLGFHHKSGEGYAFLADQVIILDALNPQVAARILAPFTHWQRYENKRGLKMKSNLKRILRHKGLSKDVYEIVSKSLSE